MSEKKDYSYLLDILDFAIDENEIKDKINIKLEGDFFNNNSISKINKNLAKTFSKDKSYNLSLHIKDNIKKLDPVYQEIKDYINKELENEDITITHYSKYSFILPKKHWAVYINWDYGSLPEQWIEALSDYVDQIWVSSNYMKNCFIDSKIDENKIVVVNSAIDSLNFNPNINTNYKIPSSKKIKFLYKGSANWESGLDILLKAYLDEFTNDDKVCLVLCIDKINIDNRIEQIIKDASNDNYSPEILILDSNLISPDENIYKSSKFFVTSYRTEAYCLELLEAMASGIPTIVNNIGASSDYCNDNNSIIVKSNIVFETKKEIKGIKTLSFPFWIESEINDLRVKMRKAYNMDTKTYKKLSKNSSNDILSKNTYIKTNSFIKDLINNLKEKPIKKELQNSLNLKILEAIKSININDFDKAYNILKEAYKGNEKNPNLNFYLSNLCLRYNYLEEGLGYIYISLYNNPNNEDYNNIAGILLYKLGIYSMSKKFFEKTLNIMPEHEGAFISLKAIEDLGNTIDTNNKNIEDILELFDIIINDFRYSKLPTLSVCMITKNEEKYIEKSIRSIKNIADEIIVLDTGSTDNTIKIAKKEGAIVYNSIWENDFSKARNLSIEKATKEWILILDADEMLTKESAKALKSNLIGLSKDLIYSPKIKNIMEDNTISEEIYHFVTRIIPNKKGIRFIKPIHEYPVSEDGKKMKSAILSNIEIIHYGYSPKIMDKKNKTDRNIKILNKLINEEPQEALNYYYLSNMLFKINDFEKSIEASEKAIYLIEKSKNSVLKHIKILSQINTIAALIYEKKYIEAKEFSEKYNKDLNNRPDYWFLYGSIELNFDNYDKAIEYANKALDLKGENIYPSVDVGTLTWKPLYLIAKVYSKQNNYKKAIEYYRKAIKENPEHILLYIDLTNIYIEQKDFKSIEKTLYYFINRLSKSDISILINTLLQIYIEENRQDHFVKLLEIIRSSFIGKAIQEDDYILAKALIDIYKKIINKSKNKLSIKYSIACIENYINNQDEAKKLFYEILKEKENDIDCIYNIANIELANNNTEKSKELYNKIILLDNNNILSLEGLAKIEIINKNFDKVREYINDIAKIEPNSRLIRDLEFEITNKIDDKELASDMYAAMLFNISMN